MASGAFGEFPFKRRRRPDSADALSLFDGGGQMGELMRSINWAQTPLGPVKKWPQSLKTALSILLKQRTAVFIFWGPEHVQFYNDAYRPILGTTKHPAAMGQRGAECWPEIWDIILPMLQAVQRGESTAVKDGLLVIDRHGYLEEGYYTYTYSPIAEETGTVGGVFCVVYDTTDRVIGERRLRTLRDLASRTATRDAGEACLSAVATLAANPYDVPFAALYLYENGRKCAKLAGAAGIEAGSPACPQEIAFGGGELSILAQAASTGRVVEISDLAQHVALLPGGPWSVGAESGIVLPLMLPGQALPTGFLIAGVNPRKRLDIGYRTFFELVAGQIATAVAEARAYEEERKRAEALAELDRAKTTFFSNVSHEFRTPLTLMLGPLTDILTREPVFIEQCRNELAMAHRNCLRLLKLVNTLLDFSRIEAGRVQARYEPADLATLTSDLASVFRSACEKANLRLTVQCPPLPEPVFVDREMWEKIVLNLLSNAFKYTFEGEIAVSLLSAGKTVELSVTDTGVGIAEAELEHVFERFRRVEGTAGRSQEGSGIGLALVQELVKLHGGGVRVESQIGKGSTFTVSIPCGSAHLPADRIGAPRTQASLATGAQSFLEEILRWLPDPAPPSTLMEAVPSRSPEQEAPTAQVQRSRILIADDNADMRDYLRRLLADSYDVETVSDGKAALDRVKREPPDLLLTDVMMPGLDGFGLLQRIRAHADFSALPVILLSARAGEESRVEGLRAGADDYIVKPFSARELLARISSRLEIARLRQGAAEAERRLLGEAEVERHKLRDLIQLAPAAMAVLWGPDHVFQLVNRDYVKAVGRSEESLIGKSIREALPEIAHQVFPQLLDRVYRTGEPHAEAEAHSKLDRRGDGTLEDRYFNFVCQPWKDAKGAVQGVFVHAVDISDQVFARRRLEESDRRLRSILDREQQARSTAELLNRVGPTLVSQLDFRALVQSVTEIATELVGAEFGVFIDLAGGKPDVSAAVSVAGTAEPEKLHLSLDTPLLSATLRDRRAMRVNDVRSEPQFAQLFGQLAARSCLTAPVISRSGEVLGGLLFAHSAPTQFVEAHEQVITGIAAQAAIAIDNARLFEQAQWVQGELKRSNQELRRANRDLEVFAYSASHDLQEPLRAVAISAQLLERSLAPQVGGEDALFLSTILAGAKRITGLVEDLLAYLRATKYEEGPIPNVDSRRVLDDVLASLRTRIEEAGATVTVGEMPRAGIHERGLALLFQNLISNAIKYRRAEPLRVHISAQEENGWHVFSVEDNGIGIEPQFSGQIFGLFKRLHSREEYPGSGIGLAICQRVVEQYGGRIWLERSAPRTGSTFRFALPLRPAAT
jgi:PAS domain S-box-containing protein